jgi:putative tryptophan/tyrosine transport system permease protein
MISVVIGALLVGSILAPLAFGVFISYRLLRFPDLTVDGSFALGAVLSARCIIAGWDPASATAVGMLGGAAAGMLTAVIASTFRMKKLLAGILVMTALYSINLHILGKPSHSFHDEITLYNWARTFAQALFGTDSMMTVLGIRVFPVKLASLFFAGATSLAVLAALYLFFRTHAGLALRAAGGNATAARALGVNVPVMTTLALMLSNMLAALSGAMLAQEIGTAGYSDGLGMIVTGLACVILGSSVSAHKRFSVQLLATLAGALLYRLVIALLMFAGVPAIDLRLMTAAFVLLVLALPFLITRIRGRGWKPGGDLSC